MTARSGDAGDRPWRRRVGVLLATLRRTALLLGRLTVVLVRALVTGALIAGALLTAEERRARVRRWFLLTGDRWVIAGGITGAAFAATAALSVTRIVGVAQSGFVTGMFSAVISGLFSFVPIVVAVNQLTVSRVVGSISEIREQMDSARGFKSELEEHHADRAVVPNEPALFLDAVTGLLEDRAVELSRSVAGRDGELRGPIESLTGVVRAQTGEIRDVLDGTDRRRLIEMLVPMMGDNYPENVQAARRIRRRGRDRLPARSADLLEEVEELSIAMNLLRQYFKAMYVQQELSRLSRYVGYSGIGAYLVAILVVMGFAAGQPFPGWPLLLDLAVSAAVAAVVFPFALLVAFVVRIAAIAQRTAAPGPFTPLRETPAYARHRD